jgi:LytS/YehU family sensor histidine kinase
VELIERDPKRAVEQARALADLLRRLLQASEQAMLFLGEERKMVEDYLAIESMRLGDRLICRWDWDASLEGHPVIPLLLQPLVENAIKHGIAPHELGGRLEIGLERLGAELILEVRNSGDPYHAVETQGIGLRNLKARLALAYGDRASLEIGSEAELTVARIRLPASGVLPV